MLSAHQPLERFPFLIKNAARSVGATAQVAGGIPAMCDGVTQGRAGMELSLFSREVIALSTAVSLSHDMFDGALMLGVYTFVFSVVLQTLIINWDYVGGAKGFTVIRPSRPSSATGPCCSSR